MHYASAPAKPIMGGELRLGKQLNRSQANRIRDPATLNREDGDRTWPMLPLDQA
jgi:hypothetical protein